MEEETNEENLQENRPESPVKKAITLADVDGDVNKLVELHEQKISVNFPPWVKPTEKEQGLKIIHQELSIHIIDNSDIISVKLGNSKGITLYKYEEGRYKLWSECDAKASIKKELPRKIRKYNDWDCVYRELITETPNAEEADLNADEDIINFKNRSTKT